MKCMSIQWLVTMCNSMITKEKAKTSSDLLRSKLLHIYIDTWLKLINWLNRNNYAPRNEVSDVRNNLYKEPWIWFTLTKSHTYAFCDCANCIKVLISSNKGKNVAMPNKR